MRWLLEPEVFGPREHPLAAAARRAGHSVVTWRDEWWTNERFPAGGGDPTLFHGSLGNAARIARLPASVLGDPGSLCDVARFRCAAWYPRARQWLIDPDPLFTSVRELCAAPGERAAPLNIDAPELFVRPDSPLKPFSGRVVSVEGLTPAHLDCGFYYDDLDEPIVVSPVVKIGREWRFFVVSDQVVCGCEYLAEGRQARAQQVEPGARELASQIAAALEAPQLAYVLDVCETPDGLRLVELNPFSGADPYLCDPDAIVAAIAHELSRG